MFLLLFFQVLHLLNEIFLSSYVFIFPKKYDIYYICYILFIIIHWILLKNECIISYIEKKLIDKDYSLGSKPYLHPYHSFVPTYLIHLFEILKFINLLIIYFRNSNDKVIFTIMIIIFGFLFFNFFKKYNHLIKKK